MLRTSLSLLALLSAPSTAQSLVAFDAQGSQVVEFTGPRRALWNGPEARVLELWPTVTQSPCAPPLAFGAPPFLPGDVAVDMRNDTVWVTDGGTIAEYSRRGDLLRAFPMPLFASPITGMGMDSELGELWITDGFQAARFQPPLTPCDGMPVLTVPPFTLFSTNPPNPATDIEWDPSTSTLWICDSLGNVGNLNVDGTLGPAGGFVATGTCGLTTPLTGLALDTTVAPPHVIVTDGLRIQVFEPSGAAADATFAITQDCQLGTGQMLGLAFSNRPLRSGAGRSPVGPIPVIDAVGQVFPGNLNFRVELRDAEPLSIAILYQSPFLTCPLGTLELLLLPKLGCRYAQLGSRIVDATGFADFAQPAPATLVVGESLVYHWMLITPSFQFQLTKRLRVTLGEI